MFFSRHNYVLQDIVNLAGSFFIRKPIPIDILEVVTLNAGIFYSTFIIPLRVSTQGLCIQL